MKRRILNLSKGILSMLLWTFSLCAFTQNVTIGGTVPDVNGEPLIGVTVKVQGTTIGTITDADGIFNLINIPSITRLDYSLT